MATRALIGRYTRSTVMNFNDQEQFEQEYADHTGMPLVEIVDARLSNGSYNLPKIATAYTWWKKSRDKLLASMGTPKFYPMGAQVAEPA